MTSAISSLLNRFWFRSILLFLGVATLAFVYMFQELSLARMFGIVHPNIVFAVNRSVRMIINDFACFLIIWAIFRERNYLKLALYIFLIELLVILPIYLVIKLSLEGDSEISSPLLSHIHRLIVNPMLMVLLMLGFFYQRRVQRGQKVTI